MKNTFNIEKQNPALHTLWKTFFRENKTKRKQRFLVPRELDKRISHPEKHASRWNPWP